MGGTIEYQLKKRLAPNEEDMFTNFRLLGSSDESNIISLNIRGRDITFITSVCYDFLNDSLALSQQSVDLVFVPSYNNNLVEFYTTIRSFIICNPSYVINCNSTKYGNVNVGGSSICCIMDSTHQEQHYNRNYIETLFAPGDNSHQIPEHIKEYKFVAANCSKEHDQILIASLDVTRPYVISPRAIRGNDASNIRVLHKANI